MYFVLLHFGFITTAGLVNKGGVVNSSGNSISRGNPSLHPHHQINNSHQIHYSASQDVYSNSAATPGSAGNQFLYFTLWLELIRLSNISGQLFLLKCQF